MKAAVIYEYGSPEVFRIEEIARPIIRDDEVLIKVKAASINPVDWKQRQGWHRLFLKAHFPVVLGYDVAGEIMECGSGVKRFKSGDQVYARLIRRFGGAFAEYAAAAESLLSRKPENISWEEAAAVPLAAITALQGLRDKCQLKNGQKVLIIGSAGGVGHFALQLSMVMGGYTVAVCSGRHQKMMEDLKPDKFIDYTREYYKSQAEQYDVIFDAAGVDNYPDCRHILKPGGVFLTTLPRPKLLVHKFLAIFSKGKKVKTFLMKSKGSDLEIISDLIRQEKLKIYIDSVYPLEDIASAHKRAEQYTTEGKIIIKISE
ncbi:MAG: hypothetical protein AMS27_06380 [Bacteroides sp. SM23_62_1]|nr:MAG: hypothetical protein AMS27_06380 [Bacteroides sp. SM23_62_1]